MSAIAASGSDTAITTRTAGRRIGALSGLAFAFLFLMGTASLNIPQSVTDEKLVAWWSDSGNQVTAIVSMYLFVLAGFAFLVFLVKLRSQLLAAEGGSGELTALVVSTSIVFVAALFVAAASRGAIAFATKSPLGEPLPGADTLRYMPQIGYAVLGTGGMLAAAAAMATTSWIIVRTAVFGRWLAWVGAIAALLTVGAVAALSGGLAIPAMLVWAAAASVAMWRRSG